MKNRLRFRPGSLAAIVSLLCLATGLHAAPPVITSATADSVDAGEPYTYSITATNTPTSFGAVNLPAGLSTSGATISGTVNTAGVYTITMFAGNADGSDIKDLVLTVNEVGSAPVLTANSPVTGILNAPFSYFITAENNPTSFSVTGLASFPGLALDPSTGEISGTPTAVASGDLIVTATNSLGSDIGLVNLTIEDNTPTAITSILADTATEGQSYTYTIEADGLPTTFGASPLPPGLNRNGATISGVPTASGVYNITLVASGPNGSDSQTLVLTVDPASPPPPDPVPVFTSPGSATGNLGSPFSFTVTASNSPTSFGIPGQTPVSFAPDIYDLAPLGFPGLQFNADTQQITGTPTAAANGDIPFSATNASGTGFGTLELSIDSPSAVPAITSSLSESVNLGTFFSYSIQATNSPLTYAISGDALPAGLSFSGNQITGVPTETGTFSITLEATNVIGTGSATLTLVVNQIGLAPVITSADAATGNVGSAFSYSVTATNNPTAFSIIGLGSFPGLSFNPATGVISGTPTSTASGTVVISATNAAGTDTANLSITIGGVVNLPPAITSPLTETVTRGQFFSYAIAATNSPDTFAIAGDPLPNGLSFSGNTISGIPTELGTFNIDLQVTNDFGSDAETLVLNVVDPAPVITSAGTASGNVGTPFSFFVEADNNPTSFGISGLSGTFPGLSFNSSTGEISGTPTAAVSGNVVVSATNAAGTTTASLALTIAPAPSAPVIDSSLAEEATVGSFFIYSITATNAPDTFALSGDPLPDGLSFSGSTISGIPTELGTFNIDLEASNAFGTGTATLVLTVADPAPVITSASTAGGNINVPFSYSIEATNNPTSFGIIGLGSFPGLIFNSSTGEISGTPTTEVSGDVVVSATNAAGTDSATVTLIFDSDQPPAITSSLTEEVTLGDFFFYPITATNSPSLYAISGDALPEGLSFSSGFISGTPTETGTFNIDLEATNSFGTGTATLVLTVADPAPIITSPTIAVGNVNSSFSFFVTAANNPSSFGITGLGSFPGLSFNSTTGEISGTPTATATGSVTVSATNAAGTDSDTLSITIDPELGPPVITSSLTESTSVGAGYSYTILATNSPTVYSISGDALPSGLTRSGNLISGTPAESGTFNIDLIATNALGSDTQTLVLTIADPLPSFVSASEAVGQVSDDFFFQVAADPNITSYSVSGLAAIGGLSLDSGTGEITGTPVNSGSFDVIVEATNATGTTQRLLSIFILEAEDLGTGPTVNVISVNGVDPATSPTFPADAGTLEFVAEVEPDAGETLEVVFLRWRNPPLSLNVTRQIMVELVPEDPLPASGPIAYTGTVDLGFDPSNRDFTGGELQFDVVATQRNDTTDAITFGTSAEESVVVAPLIDIIQPTDEAPIKSIDAGSIFAGVRLATNAFASIRAQLSGVDTIFDLTDSDESDNPNGVFSFNAPENVDFPGVYQLTITATDSTGSETTLTREITIFNDPTVPVSVVTSPRPGFSNTVFTPAQLEWVQDGEPDVERDFKENEDTGLVSGTITATYTYEFDILTRGNGYFPYNAENERLQYSFYDQTGALAAGFSLDGNEISFGRIVLNEDPRSFVVEFQTSVVGVTSAVANATPPPPGYGPGGNGLIDSAFDPGRDSRIDIRASFSKSDSELDSFRIFINGEEFTPGTGNLNPANGSIFLPQFEFPPTGSPKPGEYVVVAEVTDADGEVALAQPLTFEIGPFVEIDLDLTSDVHEGLAVGETPEVPQGTQVEYLLTATPSDTIDRVEFLDSITGEVLGEAVLVIIGGEEAYRFTRNYNESGSFSVYARATTVTNDEWLSEPLDILVAPFIDTEVTITSPTTDVSTIIGGNVVFNAEATATPGIESISFLVDNTVVETVESPNASFVFASSLPEFGVGSFVVTATALDNFGRTVGAAEQIEVTVLPADVAVSITSPTADTDMITRTSLNLTASASASPGIASIEWLVDGVVVETDASSSGSFDFVADPAVYPIGLYSLTARATDLFGNVTTSVPRLITVLESDVTVSITSPSTDQSIVLGEELTFTATASATVGVDSVRWFVGGVELTDEEDLSAPYALTYAFDSTGTDITVRAEAVDVFGSTGSGTTVNVTVNPPNPLVRNEDFVSFIYNTLLDRAPTEEERTEALALLDDTVESRVAVVESILDSENTETVGIVQLIFRTMTGEWPTATEIIEGRNVLTNDGAGVSDANALTSFLVPEYEARFGVLNTQSGFINQLFRNKHGVAPNPQSEVRLFNAAIGGPVAFGTEVIPGYNGDLISFATQFALDNTESIFTGPSGLPLSSVHFYSLPGSSTANADIAFLVSSLLGVDPGDAQVAAFAALPLDEAILQILTDENYYSQFPTASVEGEVAQYMASFGVFNLSEVRPGDDPDGDGATNEQEFNADTDPTDPADTPVASAPDVLPAALAGATSLGGDWYWNAWMGSFAAGAGDWIYSADLGWVYVLPTGTPTGTWLYWENKAAWLWGGSGLGRYFYNSATGTWIWVLSNPGGVGAWVYSVNTDTWESVSP